MATEAARLKEEKLFQGKTKTVLDTNRPSHGRRLAFRAVETLAVSVVADEPFNSLY
jgi:hypothetical protein